MKKSNRSLRFAPSDPVESGIGNGISSSHAASREQLLLQQSVPTHHQYAEKVGPALCLNFHQPLNPLVFHLQQELPFHLHPVKSYKSLSSQQEQERKHQQQQQNQQQSKRHQENLSSHYLGSDLRLMPSRRDQQQQQQRYHYHHQQQSQDRKKHQWIGAESPSGKAGYYSPSSISGEEEKEWMTRDQGGKRREEMNEIKAQDESRRDRKEKDRRKNQSNHDASCRQQSFQSEGRGGGRGEKKGRKKMSNGSISCSSSDTSMQQHLNMCNKEATALRAIYCTLLQGVDYYYAKSQGNQHQHQQSSSSSWPAGKSAHVSSTSSPKECMAGSLKRPTDCSVAAAAASHGMNSRTYPPAAHVFTRPSLSSSPSSSSTSSSSSSSSGSLVNHYNSGSGNSSAKKYNNISININNNHSISSGSSSNCGNGIGNTLGMGFSNCWLDESYTPPSPSSPSLPYHFLPLQHHQQHHLQSCPSSGSSSGNAAGSFFFSGHSVDDVIDSLEAMELTTPRPPARPWVTLATPNRNKPSCLFTVMSYNILCDKYATRQLYGYCPNWALIWEHRKMLIIDEIRNYAADIICLQEVETEQFYNFFLPELSREGYDGIFSPKSRAKTMSENDRKHVDGLAILYRKRKFSLVEKHLVEFNQMAMSNADGCDDMLNRVMTKDDIGLAALLQTREAAFDERNPAPDCNQMNQRLLVCTTHIHWDPEFCDVKLIQTMMLMHELRTILEDSVTSFRPGATKADPNSVPLLFCCDLNSLPNSGVIEFLSTGRVAADHPDFKELGYQDCLKRLSSSENKNEFTHPFKIARAYNDDAIPFTNYTFDFKGILDYVLYSKTQMSVMGILGPLDAGWLQEHKVAGFPHPHVPSDHLPLLVELELTP